MRADPVPDAITTLIDAWHAGGMAAQPPIPWPRERWVERLPAQEATLRALPAALDRATVRQACADATADSASAMSAFVVVMAWGFGNVGYGPHRSARILAAPDAPERLRRVVRTLADDGPLAAYRCLARAGDCRLPGLGPAFGTKYLHFCQPRPAETTALILDDLVGFWLDCNVTFRLDPTAWSAATHRRYLDRMHAWADALGCAADELERCMFEAEATRRGGQWAVTPTDRPR